MQSDSGPDIFEFTDPYPYLRGLYLSVKKSHSGMRLKQLTQKAGFRSVSTLSMILNQKRRLTPDAATKIGRAFDLPIEKHQYLVALARYHCSRTVGEKTDAYEELARMHRLHRKPPDTVREHRFLATWYYPVILVMAGMKDFRWSADWISSRLGGNVTPEQIRIAIGDLINLQLLQSVDGKLTRTHAALTTGEDVHDKSIEQYHRQMLKLAADSLDQRTDLREINGLTISVNGRQIPAVKEKIRKFRREMNYLLSQEAGQDGDEVYQLNIQFFPLTVPGSKEEAVL